MIIKKKKAVIAAILSAAITATALMPTVSAAGKRTKEEAFGDKSYATRFLSLYDDVITHGEENGYLSTDSRNKQLVNGGFGIPYHCVETLNVEAPDYGHETTSEAMSYIVWMAAMRDTLVNDGVKGDDGQDPGTVGDISKAWKTLEVMVPEVQTGFMGNQEPSAQYSEEHDSPEEYPTPQSSSNTGKNPIHKYFAQTYSGDTGLYLLHWLADVDDWYGYGGGNGGFTFINTFQRGSEESCWETVPHACVEELKYGMPGTRGIKGVFSTDEQVAKQWSYTNAPDAEDRAIQGIYAAKRWGVNVDSNVVSKAGKMGDQLRNNMFDKYYKKIGCQNPNDQSNSMDAAHYLMSWYTSWGGALDGQWTWQIGASHCHEFYQNPLAAYALLADADLSAAMKASNAKEDYEKSLVRQLEFYLWLQSKDGPIAGGATNSWHGRYLPYQYLANDSGPDGADSARDHDAALIKKYGTDKPTTFYDMAYLEHPVYLDPGSNHWIGNQVWAVQRLAELYYTVKNDTSSVKDIKLCDGTMTIEAALKRILDRWVEWFIKNTQLTADGDYAIPASLDWKGQPKTWTGKPDDNPELTCEITAMGSSDLGCVSSLANTLIWYAKAEGVKTEAAYSSKNTTVPEQALYLAHSLLDRVWKLGRDDIGLSRTETNGNMFRLFEAKVYVPSDYNGTMPNGDPLKSGATFSSIRSQYKTDEMYQKFEKAYNDAGGASASADAKKEAMESIELNYHRFWHAGDILLANGTMAKLYPDLEVDKYDDIVVPPTTTEPTTTEPSTTDSNPTGATTVPTGSFGDDDNYLYGDVNLDGAVTGADTVKLAKYMLSSDVYDLGKGDEKSKQKALEQADVDYQGNRNPNTADTMKLNEYNLKNLKLDDLGPRGNK